MTNVEALQLLDNNEPDLFVKVYGALQTQDPAQSGTLIFVLASADLSTRQTHLIQAWLDNTNCSWEAHATWAAYQND